jgi:hypothetical protein
MADIAIKIASGRVKEIQFFNAACRVKNGNERNQQKNPLELSGLCV